MVGLRQFEDNGPQSTPVARFNSDFSRLLSLQVSAMSEDREPCDVLDSGAEILLVGPG